MKKNFLQFLFPLAMIFLFCSCQKNKIKNDQLVNNLSLTSPEGKVLAKNIKDLKLQMNPQIFRKFKTDTIAYEVTNIKYASTKSGGMIVDITYKTSDRIESNLIIMEGVKEKVNANGNVRLIIDDKYSKSERKMLSENIKHSYSCSGPECCKVHALEHPDGSVDVDCSCGGCKMTID